MKVTINHDELATILSALESSETRWRTDAGKQLTGPSRNACIQVATELHDIHDNLVRQAADGTRSRPMSEAQTHDPFEAVWNPDDPRFW